MQARKELSSTGLWLAAALAFSPALVELVRQSVSIPRTATPAFAAVLLLLAALRSRERRAPDRARGVRLLAIASALELFGILGGAATLTCASLPLAILGMARVLGHPALRIAVLSVWWVPIPVSLLEPIRGSLEHGAAAVMTGLLWLGGSDAVAVGPLLRTGAVAFELQPLDAGLRLAHLLSLLAWYGGVLQEQSLPHLARRAGVAALLALPLQAIFLAIAALLLVAAGPAAARAWLDVGVPVGVVITGLVWAERR